MCYLDSRPHPLLEGKGSGELSTFASDIKVGLNNTGKGFNKMNAVAINTLHYKE